MLSDIEYKELKDQLSKSRYSIGYRTVNLLIERLEYAEREKSRWESIAKGYLDRLNKKE
jgi:hypothetical protein